MGNLEFFRYIEMYHNFEEEGEDSVANYTGCTQDCIRYSYSTEQIISNSQGNESLTFDHHEAVSTTCKGVDFDHFQ